MTSVYATCTHVYVYVRMLSVNRVVIITCTYMYYKQESCFLSLAQLEPTFVYLMMYIICTCMQVVVCTAVIPTGIDGGQQPLSACTFSTPCLSILPDQSTGQETR